MMASNKYVLKTNSREQCGIHVLTQTLEHEQLILLSFHLTQSFFSQRLC